MALVFFFFFSLKVVRGFIIEVSELSFQNEARKSTFMVGLGFSPCLRKDSVPRLLPEQRKTFVCPEEGQQVSTRSAGQETVRRNVSKSSDPKTLVRFI